MERISDCHRIALRTLLWAFESSINMDASHQETAIESNKSSPSILFEKLTVRGHRCMGGTEDKKMKKNECWNNINNIYTNTIEPAGGVSTFSSTFRKETGIIQNGHGGGLIVCTIIWIAQAVHTMWPHPEEAKGCLQEDQAIPWFLLEQSHVFRWYRAYIGHVNAELAQLVHMTAPQWGSAQTARRSGDLSLHFGNCWLQETLKIRKLQFR